MTGQNVKELSVEELLKAKHSIVDMLNRDWIVEIKKESKDETGLQQK